MTSATAAFGSTFAPSGSTTIPPSPSSRLMSSPLSMSWTVGTWRKSPRRVLSANFSCSMAELVR